MLLALAGTLALVMVVVTSVSAARRRLRYESWHLLHLYAYLGTGLALPHQLWTGADFRASTVATAFWWGLYGATLASVLAFRVLLPLVRSRRHRLVVCTSPVSPRRSPASHRTPPGPAPVRAGQFFHWRFLDGGGSSRPTPISLSAAPDGRPLRLTAASVGDSTARLATLRPGTQVLIEGPYGRLHAGVRHRTVRPHRRRHRHHPAPSAAGGAAARPDATVVIYRSAAPTIVLAHELLDLDPGRGGRSTPSSATGTRSAAGNPPAATPPGQAELLHIVPDIAERDVFVCGPPAWIDSVVDAAPRQASPRRPSTRALQLLRKKTSMRRIVLWAMSTLTLLVLLLSYHTSQGASTAVASSIEQLNNSAASSTDSSSSTTYAGDTVQTRFGTCRCRSPSAAAGSPSRRCCRCPRDRHDQMINSLAVPILQQRGRAAQSADIDVVSGATFTWRATPSSLQSAIDAAEPLTSRLDWRPPPPPGVGAAGDGDPGEHPPARRPAGSRPRPSTPWPRLRVLREMDGVFST